MLWKKSKEASNQTPEGSPLAPWEGLAHSVFRFYQSSYQELFSLEKWEWSQLFEKTRKQSLPQNLHAGLQSLQIAFEDARRKELKAGHRYIADLRGLIWAGIDQVCQVVEAGEKQRVPLEQARLKLQKALTQSDLEGARKVMREVLSALLDLDRQRQQTIDRLQKSFHQQLELLQSELQTAHRELQLDGLTQIYNRSTFDRQLQQTHQLSYLTGQVSCMIMIDIDHFKKVNDTFGHPAGDLVIQCLAKTIAQCFPRKSDFVARYGGEEFVALLQGCELREARELVAKLLVKVKGLSIKHGPHTISFTISAGLAAYQSGDSPEQWLARADRALYEAKQLGRDRYTIAAGRQAS